MPLTSLSNFASLVPRILADFLTESVAIQVSSCKSVDNTQKQSAQQSTEKQEEANQGSLFSFFSNLLLQYLKHLHNAFQVNGTLPSFLTEVPYWPELVN